MNANRLWIIGASLAVVVIMVLAWVLGVSPKISEAQAAASAQAQVDIQNAAHEAALVVLREQFANLPELEDELEALQAKIPGDPNIEDFIDYVKATADAAGVTISKITLAEPSGTAPAAAAAPPPAGDSTEPAPPLATANLFGVGMEIDVEGPPEAVMLFTRGLQNAERIYVANLIKYSSGNGGVRGGTVTGLLFVLRGTQTVEAPVE